MVPDEDVYMFDSDDDTQEKFITLKMHWTAQDVFKDKTVPEI